MERCTKWRLKGAIYIIVYNGFKSTDYPLDATCILHSSGLSVKLFVQTATTAQMNECRDPSEYVASVS
jgi:hypothetical protein